MNPIRFIKYLSVLVILCFGVYPAMGQETSISPDELFKQARTAAFDEKDHRKAKDLCIKALQISPEYTDISVFLGRLYTWTDQPDSARKVFDALLKKEPGHEDASLAYGTLEFWENNSGQALAIVDTALQSHPGSGALLLLKAKVLNGLDRFQEANEAAQAALRADPKNAEARALASRIKDNTSNNSVGMTYEFVHFDKQFKDPWHLASFDYGRQTGFGSVTTRINYARRFAESGLQFELEAYPRISKTFYAYVGGAYSADAGIFPEYRAGFSLYANLPSSFEAEAGFRFLHFSDNTLVYTLSAGKYYKNYWFNFRTYLVPSGENISQSYALTTRYYYGGADDFFSLTAGTGISPDDNSSNILLASDYKLKTSNLGLGFRKSVNKRDVIILGTSWQNQEFRQDTWGNQFSFSAGYQKRF